MSSGRTSVLVLVVLFLAVLAVTNPTGNFPLNDDWSYGQAVQNLVRNHDYRLSNWTSMPLLTQVLWGALFSLPAGFSFTALRLSTLLLSLAALLFLLRLVRRKQDPLFPAMLAPLVLLFNPVYLNLSHTFMTDVPFIAFMLGSTVLLTEGAERGNKALLTLGVCLALLAALLRQTGVLIPAAFGIGYLARGRAGTRRVLLAAGFFLLTVAAFVAYARWLTVTGRLPSGYYAQTRQMLATLQSGLPAVAHRIVGSMLVTYTYVGLFTLPLGLLFFNPANWRRLAVLVAVSAALLALAQVLHVGFAGNILSDRGVGAFTLAHSAAFPPFTGSPASKVVLGILALAGGALLLELLVRILRSVRSSFPATFCLSLACLCFVSLLLVQQFDRYALIYLPLLAIPAFAELRALRPAKAAVAAAFSVLLLYAGFSVSAVHDYLAWNRTRWQAISYLTHDLRIPVDKLDGGFEFNGMYTYSDDYVRNPNKSPWWVRDNEYVVAFDRLPGVRRAQGVPGEDLASGRHQVHLRAQTRPARANPPMRPPGPVTDRSL